MKDFTETAGDYKWAILSLLDAVPDLVNVPNLLLDLAETSKVDPTALVGVPVTCSVVEGGAVLLLMLTPDSKIELSFQVPDEATPEQTMEAVYQTWDALYPTPGLASKLLRPLLTLATTRGKADKREVGRITAAEILDFINGYTAGNILTPLDVPEYLSASVFMPLGLGAFEPKKDPFKKQRPGPGPKMPDAPTPPTLPEKPIRENEPEKPATVLPDPAKLAEIHDRTWDDIDQALKDKKVYLDTVAAENQRLLEEWRVAHSEWASDQKYTPQVADWQAQCDSLLATHQKELDSFNKTARAKHFRLKTKWAEKKARVEMADGVYQSIRLQDVGMVWASTVKHHVMPRKVNGFPCFSEMAVLHKEDYRVIVQMIQEAAAQREELRRKLAVSLGQDPDAPVPPPPKNPMDDAKVTFAENEDGTVTKEMRWMNPDGKESVIGMTMSKEEALNLGNVIHIQ